MTTKPTTPVTRKAAHAAGLKRYYTGRPCAHGHDAERFVSTGNCVACSKAASSAFKSDQNKARIGRLRGMFTYRAHPDDHAALLAYAQALDMARGMVPEAAPVAPVMTPRTPEQIAQDRQRIFGLAADMTRPEVDPLAHGWK